MRKKISDLSLLLDVPINRVVGLSYNVSHYYRNKYIDDIGKTIPVPLKPLKLLQSKIKTTIIDKIPLSKSVYSRKGYSIIKNAIQHLNQDVVITLDIKKFFPSVHYSKVFNLYKEIGYDHNSSCILTRLTTYDGCLPHGAPTSMGLSNIILTNMDKRIETLCKKIGAKNSRWVDDIAISGSFKIKKFLNLFIKIIKQEGYKVHTGKKKKVMCSHERQVVTNFVINEKAGITKEKERNISSRITHLKQLKNQKAATEEITQLEESIRGQIRFARMLNPKQGNRLYYKLIN